MRIYILLLLVSIQANYVKAQNAYKEPIFYLKKRTIKHKNAEKAFIEKIEKAGIDGAEAADFYILRGWYFYHRNSLDTAMLKFNQAWLLNPEDADIYWGMGCIMGRKDEVDRAIDLFGKGLQKDKEHVQLMMHLSSAYVQKTFLPYITQNNKNRLLFTANRLIWQVIDKDPDNGDAYYRGAIIAYLRNDYEKAWEALEMTKKLSPYIIQHDFVDELRKRHDPPVKIMEFEYLNDSF